MGSLSKKLRRLGAEKRDEKQRGLAFVIGRKAAGAFAVAVLRRELDKIDCVQLPELTSDNHAAASFAFREILEAEYVAAGRKFIGAPMYERAFPDEATFDDFVAQVDSVFSAGEEPNG